MPFWPGLRCSRTRAAVEAPVGFGSWTAEAKLKRWRSHSTEYVLHRGFGTSGFLGPEPGASRLLEENSPAVAASRIVPQLRKQRLYFDCGTEDESLASSRAFHRELADLGVPHEYHEFPGSHTWGYWSRHLRESLLAVASALH